MQWLISDIHRGKSELNVPDQHLFENMDLYLISNYNLINLMLAENILIASVTFTSVMAAKFQLLPAVFLYEGADN